MPGHLPSDDLTLSELGTLTSVTNQENPPTDLTTEQSGRGIFSIKVSFFQVGPSLCQADTRQTSQHIQ